jgi:two-component system copper resistance phosphate regulon response regulator CusR
MKILIVEDEKKVSAFLHAGMTEQGYDASIAETGSSAEALAAAHAYHLILMDINLPDQNGIETARHIRARGYTGPILMLTASGQTQSKVSALDGGADDYLVKPFDFDELLARMRALLRRNQTGAVQAVLKFSDLVMDLVSRDVQRAGTKVVLTQKEFALLEFFIRNATRPISRNQISEQVWNMNFDNESNVIDVYVNLLRKKIDAPFGKKLIHTVVGYGYVLKEST